MSEQDPRAPEHGAVARSDLVRIGLVGLAVVFCWLRVWEPFPKLDVIGLAAVPVGGYPIYREALVDILSRRMTMELSMTIALAAATGHPRGLHRPCHRVFRADR